MGRQGEIAAVVAEAEFSEQVLRGGSVPVATDPESFTALIKNDLAKWERVVRAANIQPG
jgi:tripartite-type tricarboxylate transporter receptor subunit TctC